MDYRSFNVLSTQKVEVSTGGPENGQHQPKVQIGQQKNQPDPSLDYALHFFSLVILQAFMSISEISNPLVTHIPILMPQVNVM